MPGTAILISTERNRMVLVCMRRNGVRIIAKPKHTQSNPAKAWVFFRIPHPRGFRKA